MKAATASGECRYFITRRPASSLFALRPKPAAKTVTLFNSAGRLPTFSTPATETISGSSWIAKSASPPTNKVAANPTAGGYLVLLLHFLPKKFSAAMNASLVGHRMVEHRIDSAKAALRLQLKEEEDRQKKREAEDRTETVKQEAVSDPELIPDHHLVVARLSDAEMKNIKLKEILGPLKEVINTALPLVEAPPLHEARNVLQFEFPHAIDVIDFALADLVGRTTVRLRPS